jgi:hypothetical protein
VACPYFIPTTPHPGELWPHRHRLPLGDGFAGRCCARNPGPECDDETLRLQCNLGYAQCAHLPVHRELDAVRFHVSGGEQGESQTLRVQFCGERAHLPAKAGEWHFNLSTGTWVEPPDPRLRALADAAVRVWIASHARSMSAAK